MTNKIEKYAKYFYNKMIFVNFSRIPTTPAK